MKDQLKFKLIYSCFEFPIMFNISTLDSSLWFNSYYWYNIINATVIKSEDLLSKYPIS